MQHTICLHYTTQYPSPEAQSIGALWPPDYFQFISMSSDGQATHSPVWFGLVWHTSNQTRNSSPKIFQTRPVKTTVWTGPNHSTNQTYYFRYHRILHYLECFAKLLKYYQCSWVLLIRHRIVLNQISKNELKNAPSSL